VNQGILYQFREDLSNHSSVRGNQYFVRGVKQYVSRIVSRLELLNHGLRDIRDIDWLRWFGTRRHDVFGVSGFVAEFEKLSCSIFDSSLNFVVGNVVGICKDHIQIVSYVVAETPVEDCESLFLSLSIGHVAEAHGSGDWITCLIGFSLVD